MDIKAGEPICIEHKANPREKSKSHVTKEKDPCPLRVYYSNLPIPEFLGFGAGIQIEQQAMASWRRQVGQKLDVVSLAVVWL
jgi:hypothetical protein